MRKKLPTARTISTAISSGPAKVYVRKMRGKHFAQAYTVNQAGKRGLHNPPAQ